MVHALKVKSDETGPTALENRHGSVVVPSPKFAGHFAGGVDNAELVFLLGVRRSVEVDDYVEIFLRAGVLVVGVGGPGGGATYDVEGRIVDVPRPRGPRRHHHRTPAPCRPGP